MPNPGLFPFTSIKFELSDGTKLKASAKDVTEALQYSPTPGLPDLTQRIKRMQIGEHKPHRPISVSIVPGSQDGLAKAFDALIDEGDCVLIEAPTYSGESPQFFGIQDAQPAAAARSCL